MEVFQSSQMASPYYPDGTAKALDIGDCRQTTSALGVDQRVVWRAKIDGKGCACMVIY